MRRLVSFTSITLDGYFTSPDGDMSWAHGRPFDAEWNEFVDSNASQGGRLLFGRVTYDMMAGYWPTPMAEQQNPVVAKGMNEMPKVVFSRSMTEAGWQNTTLLSGDPCEEVRRLKAEDGPDMAILGSGSIIAQLAKAGLIDEFQFVVIPIAIGAGRTVFDSRVDLKLTKTRSFANGNVVLWYEPAP